MLNHRLANYYDLHCDDENIMEFFQFTQINFSFLLYRKFRTRKICLMQSYHCIVQWHGIHVKRLISNVFLLRKKVHVSLVQNQLIGIPEVYFYLLNKYSKSKMVTMFSTRLMKDIYLGLCFVMVFNSFNVLSSVQVRIVSLFFFIYLPT